LTSCFDDAKNFGSLVSASIGQFNSDLRVSRVIDSMFANDYSCSPTNNDWFPQGDSWILITEEEMDECIQNCGRLEK